MLVAVEMTLVISVRLHLPSQDKAANHEPRKHGSLLLNQGYLHQEEITPPKLRHPVIVRLTTDKEAAC